MKTAIVTTDYDLNPILEEWNTHVTNLRDLKLEIQVSLDAMNQDFDMLDRCMNKPLTTI